MSEIYCKFGNCAHGEYRGLNGEPVERSPLLFPYSYDEFVIYKTEEYETTDSSVYSDRMKQWDGEAFKKACATVWPENPSCQSFHSRSPEDINKFLNLYLNKEVKLTAILQGCNASNGYPYWLFVFKE
jgi:hypothetical protein